MEHQVLCCGSRPWALFVGSLQTISGLVGLIFAILPFFGKGIVREYLDSKPLTSMLKKAKTWEEQKTIAIVAYSFLIISSVVVLFAGIILIVGTKLRKKGLLNLWLFGETIYIIFLVIGGAAAMFGEKIDWFAFGFNIFQIILTLLCTWIVVIHRREVKAKSEYRNQEDEDDAK